jgi:hypothetical protein
MKLKKFDLNSIHSFFRKIILLISIFNLFTIAYTQVIKGIVLDHNTKSPVYFASIYFNGTFVITHSEQNGVFELDVSKYSSMPLSISASGYYSNTLNDFSTENEHLIWLEPKISELREVVVSVKAKAAAREKRANMKLFKDEFLGTTMNAKRCEIINENDITLTFNDVTETMSAFSAKPIQINNKGLGYQIIFYLDKFEYNKPNRSLIFTGNYIFKEDTAATNNQKKIYEKRRKTAYLGSRMNFLRALWENSLDSCGFLIMNSANQKLPYSNLIFQTDSLSPGGQEKYLTNTGDLLISYLSKNPGSSATFLDDYVYFDKNGYFDPHSISWKGEMANQRIADMLPYEYSVNEINHNK